MQFLRKQLDTEKGRRKKASSNAGQPVCTKEGQVDSKKLTLPKWKIYSSHLLYGWLKVFFVLL